MYSSRDTKHGCQIIRETAKTGLPRWVKVPLCVEWPQIGCYNVTKGCDKAVSDDIITAERPVVNKICVSLNLIVCLTILEWSLDIKQVVQNPIEKDESGQVKLPEEDRYEQHSNHQEYNPGIMNKWHEIRDNVFEVTLVVCSITHRATFFHVLLKSVLSVEPKNIDEDHCEDVSD